MEPLKPCKCGNEYPTLRIVDCASGSKLYQVYCKDCKKSASVSTSREEAETYWNKDMARNDLKPCPFCGTDLQKFPEIMCINRAYNEDYLKWLHENGKFVGSDRDYQVSCVKCGSTGARGATKSIAISKWNRRADNETD